MAIADFKSGVYESAKSYACIRCPFINFKRFIKRQTINVIYKRVVDLIFATILNP